jgi:hypothetical protein
MRTILHLSLSAALLGFIMLCPAFAQTTPPAKIQPKDEEAELKAIQERLQKLIAELRAKVVRPAVQVEPAIAALEKLAKSSDPKVAALAKELLAALPKPVTSKPGTFLLEWDGHQPGGNPGGGLEFRLEGPPLAKLKPGAPIELKIENFEFEFEPNLKVQKPQVASDTKSGGSTLKMSADGKTAAVVGADGSNVIYDVATGKEQMRFPAKR